MPCQVQSTNDGYEEEEEEEEEEVEEEEEEEEEEEDDDDIIFLPSVCVCCFVLYGKAPNWFKSVFGNLLHGVRVVLSQRKLCSGLFGHCRVAGCPVAKMAVRTFCF